MYRTLTAIVATALLCLAGCETGKLSDLWNEPSTESPVISPDVEQPVPDAPTEAGTPTPDTRPAGALPTRLNGTGALTNPHGDVYAQDRPLSETTDISAELTGKTGPDHYPTPEPLALGAGVTPIEALADNPDLLPEPPARPAAPEPKPVTTSAEPTGETPTLAPIPVPDPLEPTTPQGTPRARIDELTGAPLADPDTEPTTQPAETPDPPAWQASNTMKMGVEVIVAGSVMQVNDQYVSVDEILDGLHGELSKIPSFVSEAEFRAKALDTIRRGVVREQSQILLGAEAEKNLEEPAVQQVDAELESALREMIAAAGSREQLRQKVMREGTTLDALLKNHRRAMMIDMYMRAKFVPAIVVNRRMLWDYYQKHPEQFSTPRKVQMRVISVPYVQFLPSSRTRYRRPSESARTEARAAALAHIQETLRRLKAGEALSALAKDRSFGPMASRGGLYDMMGRGNLRETKVEEAAFALPEGQHSDIIEGESGFYLVEAVKVQPGKVISFEDAQPEIEAELRFDQLRELREEYLKKIYGRATISTPQSFLAMAVNRAVERYYK